MKKNLIILLTLIMLIAFTGCFNNNESDKINASKGLIITKTEDGIIVTTEKKILATEIEIVGELSSETVLFSNDNLNIVQEKEGKKVLYISNYGMEKNISFEIKNKKNGTINLIKELSESAIISDKATKRAGEKLLGDFNGDNIVNMQDFSLLQANFGKNIIAYDIGPATKGSGNWAGIFCYANGDGIVGLEDLAVFSVNFGKEMPKEEEKDKEIFANSINIAITKINLEIGETINCTATISPENTTNKTILWEVSNPNIININAIDEIGVITAISAGTSIVTVTTSNGKTASITINVLAKEEEKEEEITGIEVYAKFTHIWAWNKNGSGEVNEFKTWPGQLMEAADGEWKKWYFPDAKSINLLFTNNEANKTDDLKITAEGRYWYINGKFETSNPEKDTVAPEMSILPEPTKLENGILYYENENLNITLKITDNQDKSPKAYYTINGSTPSASSTEYLGGEIAITDNTTLKIYTIDKDGNNKIYTYIFKLNQDTVAPIVKATPDAGRFTEGETVKVILTITDNKDSNPKLYYTIDGKEPIEDFNYLYNGQIITITERTLIKTLAVDVSGNKITKDFNYTFSGGSGGNSTFRDFREENIYFMMTDRFCDGDKSNNNIWGDEYLPGGESQMYEYSESKTGVLSYYHGGDFAGIIKHLDYLKEMGFTAIWITPVVKQPEGRYYYNETDSYEASAFHGYWGFDFDQIDPHLHSSGKNSDGWDDFKALANELHSRDMKLMLDIVVNHGTPGTPSAPTKWLKDKGTVIMDGQTFSFENDPYKDIADKSKGFFNYLGGYQCVDLIDFNERGPDGYDAREHLKNVYKRFIDAGVDAFRIDTVAYMTNEWWGEFADDMYNHAKSIGNDYFYMVGESWTGRGTAIERHSMDKTNSFHMLDMQLSCMDYPGEMHKVFSGGGDYSLFNTVTSRDEIEGLTAEQATWTGMFVDNHDVFRANGIFNEQQYKNALTYIYLFRGIPIVYYGTEAMYAWEGAYATTNKDDVVARWMFGDRGINYVKENKPPMYKHIKMLNSVRLESEAIQKGIQNNITLGGDKAIFTRSHNGKIAYVAISKGAGYSHTFTDMSSGTYKVITPNSDGTFSKTTETISGSYSVNVPDNGFVIVELN
ncbi:MAG: starch-binding protein [Fusobacteria bacterium]|nr:starch-binding protein [Fusobacteriota bacterium]